MFLHQIISFVYGIYTKLLPYCCMLCEQIIPSSETICLLCQNNLPILPNHCYKCARFLPDYENIPNQQMTLICAVCIKQRPPFDATYSLFPYLAPITELIKRLKFNHQLEYAHGFGRLFVKTIQNKWYINKTLPNLIIPIPLHRSRLRERGFNQALEIARPIAKMFNIPIDISGTTRIKPTVPQSGLTALERKRNIANAFKITKSYQGLSIAVIDDVVTTGQTVTAFSLLLKQKGAQRIDIWCCARRDF